MDLSNSQSFLYTRERETHTHTHTHSQRETETDRQTDRRDRNTLGRTDIVTPESGEKRTILSCRFSWCLTQILSTLSATSSSAFTEPVVPWTFLRQDYVVTYIPLSPFQSQHGERSEVKEGAVRQPWFTRRSLKVLVDYLPITSWSSRCCARLAGLALC